MTERKRDREIDREIYSYYCLSSEEPQLDLKFDLFLSLNLMKNEREKRVRDREGERERFPPLPIIASLPKNLN